MQNLDPRKERKILKISKKQILKIAWLKSYVEQNDFSYNIIFLFYRFLIKFTPLVLLSGTNR